MRRLTVLAVLTAAIASALLASAPARANIFTSILREAGEAGGKAASHSGSHLGAVGKAASHLKGLAGAPKGALAAHATPEGHWQFVNREGQVFTAGTADEMKRVLPALSPDIAAGESKLTLYLSEDSVFQNRAALDQLPKDANLHVVTDSGTYGVTRSGYGSSAALKAQIKPNVVVELADRAMFDETVSYLGRSLNKANIRTISLQPGASNRLPSAPKLDGASKLPQVDELDPVHLAAAFRSIRGQTALVAGRVENGKIYFTPSKGGEVSRDLDELVSAASQNDVNLVILHTDAARQPGGRNWLWQSIEVGGLKDAAKAANFGDFIEALGARRGGFQVTASREGSGRVQLAASPAETGAGLAGEASSLLEETVSHLTGEIVTKAVEMHGRDESSQREANAQLIPGIPTYVQIPYLVGIISGVFSWGTARGWWSRIWPSGGGRPADGPGPAGRIRAWLNRTPREATFLLVFLPVVGFPALMWQLAVQTWETVTAPFRWVYRRFLRREI
ncbi:MAG: hypothetical protein ABL893_02510 [Hyphomicrobium sp.]